MVTVPKEVLMQIVDDLLSKSDEEMDKLLEEAKDSPWFQMFEELDRMGEVVYQEYNPDNYVMNMVWRTKEQA